ncbi:AAA domain-containing protein [Pelagophyceae sp. CCMP2097]|nr:AAA domain-containing protein [Pelagophyceae sp. CCMP2097]
MAAWQESSSAVSAAKRASRARAQPTAAAAKAFDKSGASFMMALEEQLCVKLVVLCGAPGSGKSTLAEELSRRGWAVASQDTLKTLQKVEEFAHCEISAGGRVVVDRCNQTEQIRQVWWSVLRRAKLPPRAALVVWLDVPQDECKKRILACAGHSMLPPTQESLKIVDAFNREFEAPAAGSYAVWRERGPRIDVSELAERVDAQSPANLRSSNKAPEAQPKEPQAESALDKLAAMGWPKSVCAAALTESGGNEEQALESLLCGPSPRNGFE